VAKYLFDTNSYENKSETIKIPSPIYVSSVVLCELMTACNDVKELKAYQILWETAKKDDLLIVPNEEDWLNVSRILFLLAQERKKQAGGKAPKRTSKAKQELAMDCLIAMSACREEVTIITNDHDFWEIKRFRKNLKLLKYSD
jgi:predicted nucleic acid-binding protein